MDGAHQAFRQFRNGLNQKKTITSIIGLRLSVSDYRFTSELQQDFKFRFNGGFNWTTDLEV